MDKKPFYIRFSKDYNLPVNIFTDEMWEYYRKLYKNFWPYEAENKAYNAICTNFNCNIDKWLESYGKLRDKIIETLENSEEYKNFNTSDMSKYDISMPSCGERSYYTQETDGKYFISIDLKKANFQALKYVGVIKEDTYADFIKSFGGDDYFIDSKYLRQVIFGKLNPKRQIKVEKYLMSKVYEYISLAKVVDAELFSFNSDELVYQWCGNMSSLEMCKTLSKLQTAIKTALGIDVRIEFVKINRLPIINCMGASIDAYVRTDCFTGETKLKKASTTFFPQIYKLWKGEKINDKDKMFYFEGQYATFNNELILEDENISNK